jgi:hypothetical protein
VLGLILAAASSSPQLWVVSSSSHFGAESFVNTTREAVVQALLAHELTSIAPAADAAKLPGARCDAKVPCLQSLAEGLGPNAVVIGVDVTKVARSLAIHIDAVNAKGDVLATLDSATPIDGWLRKLADPLEAFTSTLKLNVVWPAPGPAEPKPPEPAKTEPRVLVPPRPAPAPSPRVLPWVAAAAALGSGVGAVAFSAASNDAVARWNAALETQGGATGTTLSLADTQKVIGAANSRANLALAFGLSTVVLAGLAVVLFAMS